MEEAYKAGKLWAIGLSNFQPDRLMDIKAFNEVPPAVNQIEINPFHQQAQSVTFMRESSVQAEAWAPLAEGRNNLFKNEICPPLAASTGIRRVGRAALACPARRRGARQVGAQGAHGGRRT